MSDDPVTTTQTVGANLPAWGSLQILEEVGRGGFGVVYRAWEPALARQVALKVIRPRFRPGGLDIFDGFSRTVTQPMRLTTRPLAAFTADKRWEALVVRFDATKFHGGFTAEDFGARPGSFNEPVEILWNWAVLVDPFALLWKTDRR